MRSVKLRLPISFRLFAAEVVARNISNPARIVQIELLADRFQPFEESMLPRRFLFQYYKRVILLR